MKKIQHKSSSSWKQIAGFFGLGLMTGMMLLFALARITWHTKYYPGVSVAGTPLGGMTRPQAMELMSQKTRDYQAKFSFNGSSWVTPKESVNYELETALNEAYRYGRRFALGDYLLLLVNKRTDYPLALATGKTEKMELLLKEIADSVEIAPVEASISINNQKVEVVNGSDGTVLDMEKLEQDIADNYQNLRDDGIEIPTALKKRVLTEEQILAIQERAERLLKKSITIKLEDERIQLSGDNLIALLETDGSDELIDFARIDDYTQGIKEKYDKEPQDARFAFEGGKVQEFAPGKDGIEVNVQLTTNSIQQGIEKLLNEDGKNETVEIAVTRTPPQVTTDKVNELGIKERIGRGESYYAHSIPNRIFNVGLAASRANSALIAPGEEFSFNKIVGEISGATGYRSAYVISGGRTVLGDGGGVCQVSTTLFRGAMNAGLPITERWAHAYRVGYYEQNSKPGIDATVYAPSKDMRFLNDTPGHILVQTINDPKNLHLVVEIYGTSDGRVTTVSEPKVWGITPPLPTVYQDDPSLPAGTVKQVDWSAPGAKASFEYKVMRNGEVLQDKTFTSVYRPWAAVYLRGTGN